MIGTLRDASVTVEQWIPLVPDPSPSSQVMMSKVCQMPLGSPCGAC